MRFGACALLLGPLFFVSCSDPVPDPYEGAWKVDFKAGTQACNLQGTLLTPTAVGNLANEQCATLPSAPGYPVDDDHHCGLIMDGVASARLFCAVRQQGGGYHIEAESQQGASFLSLSVDNITSAASATSPVVGRVAFASGETVNTYTSNACNFYFNEAQSKELAPGKFWLTFECPEVSYNGITPNSVCNIAASYVAFQYCEE